MVDNALTIYLLVAFFIKYLIFLFLLPLGIALYFILRTERFNRFNSLFMAMLIILIIIGILLALLGVGLTSPEIVNSNQNTLESVNIQINLDCINVSNNCESKYLILNKTQNTSDFNETILKDNIKLNYKKNPLELMGLVLGLVGLGISIISMCISTLINLYNRTENQKRINYIFKNEYNKKKSINYFIIGVVWFVFLIILNNTGISSDDQVGMTIKSFLILVYLVLGILSIAYSICCYFKQRKKFHEIVDKINNSNNLVKTPFISKYIGGLIIRVGKSLVNLGLRIEKNEK